MIPPSKLNLESHACNFASIRPKAEKNVNIALYSRLKREMKWSGQFSTVVASERMFNRVVASTSATQNVDSESISGKCKRLETMKKGIKDIIKEEHLNDMNEKVHTLTMQGEIAKLLILEKQTVTWQALMHSLPKGIMAFALKMATNTLPTPYNLKLWRKTRS